MSQSVKRRKSKMRVGSRASVVEVASKSITGLSIQSETLMSTRKAAVSMRAFGSREMIATEIGLSTAIISHESASGV